MYFVRDLEKAKKFYQDELGLIKVWEDITFKMVGFKFDQSDSEIVIHSDNKIPNPDFCFLVDNVEKYCAEFKHKGYKVFLDPIDARPGKYAILEDLDGNKLPIIDLTKFGGVPRYDN